MAKAEALKAAPFIAKWSIFPPLRVYMAMLGQVGYASAKAAVAGMTRTLAKEWGRYCVNVNCVAFGWIQTRLTQAIAS